MTFDLALIGFGNVTRCFVQLVAKQAARLKREHDLEVRVVAIATGRHGSLFRPQGVDVDRALATIESGSSLDGDARDSVSGTTVDLIRRAARETESLVVIETTPLAITDGQPAIDHVREALLAGAHVITANKGPVAFAYHALNEQARSAGRAFLFEGSVMDGVPIFNLVRETLPAVQVTGFRGVINSTTNHILTEMEAGRTFDEALGEMQRSGITEADPTLDVDGWDAAAKTAALANVLLGARLTPQLVDRTGIAGVTPDDVRQAMKRGRRLRLIASAHRRGDEVAGRVGLFEIDEHATLATLKGMQNALVLETDVLGELAITELSAGLTQTAYALLSDLVTVRRLTPDRPARRGGRARRNP